jgi:hypothetical protein
MSQLQQHRLAELIGLGRGDRQGGKPVLPGFYVRHRQFEHSFGLVVAWHHTFCHPTQVMVLWSRQPGDLTDVDIDYARKRLFAAIKVPPAFMGYP